MTIRVAVLEYGFRFEGEGGAYDHPDGGTCALSVRHLVEFDDEEAAIEWAIHEESLPYVHHAHVHYKE